LNISIEAIFSLLSIVYLSSRIIYGWIKSWIFILSSYFIKASIISVLLMIPIISLPSNTGALLMFAIFI